MKNAHPTDPKARPRAAPRRQRGVIMLFGLIALAIMLIGAAAMVRSMNTSLVNAGNLGFKRDMTNQGERAVATVVDLLRTGALAGEVARQTSSTAINYSASMLPVNAQGIPTALLSDAAFAAVGAASNDITLTDQAITVRYVVDRLCVNTGPQAAGQCAMANDPKDLSDNARSGGITAEDLLASERVVYRLSVRVIGPRNTQAFYQSTLTL
jgi:type IV pilus assembly protein PilX